MASESAVALLDGVYIVRPRVCVASEVLVVVVSAVLVQLMSVSAGGYALWILGAGLSWKGVKRRYYGGLETADGVCGMRENSGG